jgi:hypothetical protein
MYASSLHDLESDFVRK